MASEKNENKESSDVFHVPAKLHLKKDGSWLIDGEPITHRKSCHALLRNLKQNEDGSYVVTIGYERASVTVEDTPYFVEAIRFSESDTLFVVLNTDELIALDASTCFLDDEMIFRAHLSDGREVRFSRRAQLELGNRCEEKDGGYVLPLRGKDIRIEKADKENG